MMVGRCRHQVARRLDPRVQTLVITKRIKSNNWMSLCALNAVNIDIALISGGMGDEANRKAEFKGLGPNTLPKMMAPSRLPL